MKKDLSAYNKMVNRVFLQKHERRWKHKIEHKFFKDWPIYRFDADRICKNIIEEHGLESQDLQVILRVRALLSDLKAFFYFLLSVNDYFYVGMAKIIGSSRYDEVNFPSFSMLQGNHYKVHLISVSYERILDLLDLIFFYKKTDPKTNKWGKKYEKFSKMTGFDLITEAEHEKMIVFRDDIRRAEVHGFSSVVRQLDKDKWNHFQEEEKIINNIILRIADKYGTLRNAREIETILETE